MPSVTLGNVSHTALITDPETGVKTRYRSTHIEQTVEQINNLPEGLFDAMKAVVDLWRHESDQPPAWLESDSDPLAAALREHFGCGPKPEGWEIVITGPPALVPIATERDTVTLVDPFEGRLPSGEDQ
jgi:hypothetical protein